MQVKISRSALSSERLVCLLVCLCFVAVGCGGGGGGGSSSGGSTGSGSAVVVTDNPQGTVPWANIEGESNVPASMRVNDSGTTVTQIPATIISAHTGTVTLSGKQENNVQILYSQPGLSRKVYEGDSGSPVLINGNVVGGLFGSADQVHFDARGIQQELATTSGPVRMLQQFPRIAPQWHFEGSPDLIPLIRTKANFGNTIYEGPVRRSVSKAVVNSVPPLPGRRYASPIVIGPYALGFDLATYTMEMPNGKWVATGHGLEDAGTVTWPITAASVDGLSNTSDSVQAHIIGGIYGTLEWDGQDGSLIDPNVPSPTMPVDVKSTVNLIPRLTVTHQVRFDRGSSDEDQGISVAIEATLDAQLHSASSITASGTLQITAAGNTNTYHFSFPPGMSLKSFLSSVDSQISQMLQEQKTNQPSSQVAHVVGTFTITD